MGGRRLSGAGGTTSPSCSRRALSLVLHLEEAAGPAAVPLNLNLQTQRHMDGCKNLHVERIVYCLSFKLSSNTDERTSFFSLKPSWLQILSARMQIPAAPI